MPKTPFWEDNPELWDRVKIAGLTLPGLARVEAKLGSQVETKHPPGQDGVDITDLGYDPATVDVTLILWEAVHLEKLEEILPKLRPLKGDPRKHTEVVHPSLTMLGIRYLYVKEIGTLKDGQVEGTKEMALNFIEFYPETRKNAVTKKTTAVKGAATPNGNEQTALKAKPQTATRPSQKPVPTNYKR